MVQAWGSLETCPVMWRVWNHTSVSMPIGRLENFVSFMEAAREQVGRKQVAKGLRCGGGQGGRAGRTLG